MNLEDVQAWIESLLKAHPPLGNVSVLRDDGTYPKTPGREQALGTKGLCLVVWQIESDGLIDKTQKGACVEILSLAVVIEENVRVCRSDTGRNIPAEKALRFVREALLGNMPNGEPGTILRCDNPPFKNFGNRNGVQTIVASFVLDLLVVPACPDVPEQGRTRGGVHRRLAGVGAPGVPSAVPDAPPAITVPAGFRTRFERIPPPARRWIVPVGAANGPALVYAWLRAEGFPRGTATAVFQEALRAEGVGFLKRFVFRLSR